MRRFAIGLILGSVFAAFPAAAQMSELSLDARTDEAAMIVEARVLESTPFWNPDRTQILTAHRLEVHKVFKMAGKRLDEIAEIRLLTLGGRIDNHWHDIRPSLSLRPGQTGLFFVEQRNEFSGLIDVWLPVGGQQGFVRYDEFTGEAYDPFHTYPDVHRDLYEPIRARTGQPFSVVNVVENDAPASAQRGPGPVITSFSPNPVSGGVQEVLVINGSGFGTFTASANVFFDNPDDGAGGSFSGISSLHVVSWADTQIQVRVPADAGTGGFIVRDSAGVDGASPSTLTVDYALNEIVSTDLQRIFQEDENDRGGYTFRYNTNAANSGVDFTSIPDAVARFEESLELWTCATGWTADVDGTTTVNSTGDDGVNIVAFDNSADLLPSGVLGRASSFYTGCGGDWHLQGIDVRFRRDGVGVDWYFGANPAGQMINEHDFMSVAAHEIGHAVQHGHINDASDIMFWAIANGQNNRTLSTADIDGGLDILAFSVGRTSACATGMRSFNCNAAPTARLSASPFGACGTSLTTDFTDLSYDGPASWNWTFGDTTGSTARNPSHTYTSTGTYTVSLDASNVNGSDSLTVDNLIVVTSAPVAATCNPTFTGHNNCCGIGPVNVTLNTINLTTGTPTAGDPLQEDFTCSEFTVLEPSMSYPISVTVGSSNPEYVRVYIDWDNNGTFAASELVLDSPTGLVHNGTVNVPASPALDTALRMRVLSDFEPQGISSPCENIEFGQVEDYSVLVAQAAAPAPGQIASLLITKGAIAGDVDLSWGASCGAGATDYTVHEGAIGNWYSHTSIPSACTTAGATSLTGLTPQSGSRYFLVVPVSATAEGSYGTDSGGLERPVSTSVCIGTQDTTACP